MSIGQKSEVDLILEKLQGETLSHVPDAERIAAVKRAIRFLHIHSRMNVKDLVDLIDTNEEQMGVHSQPSD